MVIWIIFEWFQLVFWIFLRIRNSESHYFTTQKREPRVFVLLHTRALPDFPNYADWLINEEFSGNWQTWGGSDNDRIGGPICCNPVASSLNILLSAFGPRPFYTSLFAVPYPAWSLQDINCTGVHTSNYRGLTVSELNSVNFHPTWHTPQSLCGALHQDTCGGK